MKINTAETHFIANDAFWKTAEIVKIDSQRKEIKTGEFPEEVIVSLGSSSFKSVSDTPLDVVFLIDNSGSYGSYIDDMKRNIGDIIQSFRSVSSDFRVGLGVFGSSSFSSSHEYGKLVDLTTDMDVFSEAVNKMDASGGNERQLHALLNAVSDFSWRESSQKWIILSTDEEFDDDGDGINDMSNEFLSHQEVLEKLKDSGIHVIGIPTESASVNDINLIASGSGGFTIDLADGTQGFVEKINKAISELPLARKTSWVLKKGESLSLEKLGLSNVEKISQVSPTDYDIFVRDKDGKLQNVRIHIDFIFETNSGKPVTTPKQMAEIIFMGDFVFLSTEDTFLLTFHDQFEEIQETVGLENFISFYASSCEEYECVDFSNVVGNAVDIEV